MHALAAAAPQYVRIWNAQDEYNLSPAGDSCPSSSPSEPFIPCKHWFMSITDFSTFPSSPSRPQVFFSGNLHGDEQVGPMTLIYYAEYLINERLAGRNIHVNKLLSSRYLVMIPMTNPWGYAHIVREELVPGVGHVDPNRDFPFNQESSKCMVTITARAVNEVWQRHLFQLSLTFHGGMEAIGYEWGSPNHLAHGSSSPDDFAQAVIADTLADVAGSYMSHRYPVGKMNTLVYPVNGGMEEWAYASSWDLASTHTCSPSSFNGYPAEKTQYNNASHRAFNMIVETWNDKRPFEGQLGMFGSSSDFLTVQGSSDGHVPRNARMVHYFLDLVEPYIQTTLLSQSSLLNSLPSNANSPPSSLASYHTNLLNRTFSYQGPMPISGSSQKDTTDHYDFYFSHAISLDSTKPPPLETVSIGYDIGGAMKIDATSIVVGTWDVRIPTSFLTSYNLLSTWNSLELPNDSEKISAFQLLLQEMFHLSQMESYEFTKYMYTWQLFLHGYIKLSEFPEEYLLKHTNPVSGFSRWVFSENVDKNPVYGNASHAGVIPGAPDLQSQPFVTRFADCISLPYLLPINSQVPETSIIASYFAVPYAVVDQSWYPDMSTGGSQLDGTPPQSHIVNARTRADYYAENAGYFIKGKYHTTLLKPIFIALESIIDPIASENTDTNPTTCVVTNVYTESSKGIKKPTPSFDPSSNPVMTDSMTSAQYRMQVFAYVLMGFMGLGLLFMLSKWCQQQQRRWARRRAGYVKPGETQASTSAGEAEVAASSDDQSTAADVGNSSADSENTPESTVDSTVDVEKGNDRRRHTSNSNKLS
jgi:Zinc carboxypeptidase